MRCVLNSFAVLIFKVADRHFDRLNAFYHYFKLVALKKAVALRGIEPAALASLGNGGNIPLAHITAAVIYACVVRRRVEIEACAILPVAHLAGLVKYPLRGLIITRKARREIAVEGAAIGIDDRSGVISRFCSALYLKAVYARLDKLGDMLDKAHIL